MLEGRVVVRLFSSVKAAFGQPEISVPCERDSDLHSVLLRLCDTPARQGALFLDSGLLRTELQVLVNGRNIAFLKGLQTTLNGGDEVSIFPPMYGG